MHGGEKNTSALINFGIATIILMITRRIVSLHSLDYTGDFVMRIIIPETFMSRLVVRPRRIREARMTPPSWDPSMLSLYLEMMDINISPY